MCKHGTYKLVEVINPNQNKKVVAIDACIADEVSRLNRMSIITLGSCCSHGEAGHPYEWENDFGKWKGQSPPPHVLLSEESVELAKSLGYSPYPYFYGDGKTYGVWQMHLKTGCLTEEDVKKWHDER